MPVVTTLLGVGVVFGTISQRVSGMGFALFMAPFFVIAFGPYEGILLMNIGGAFSSALMFLSVWRDVDWTKFWVLLLTSIPGAAVGAYVATQLNSAALQVLVGSLLLLGLISMQLAGPVSRPSRSKAGAVIAGVASGFTNGTSGFGSPAIAIYGLLIHWPQRSFAATLQPLFIVMSMSALLLKTSLSGQAPALDWWIYPAMLVLIVIGNSVGEKVKGFLDEDFVRRLVIFLCYTGAVAATASGLWKLFAL
jgi:uncharacterized membrane protein YfcA